MQRRAETRALLRAMRNLTIRIEMMASSRKALRNRKQFLRNAETSRLGRLDPETGDRVIRGGERDFARLARRKHHRRRRTFVGSRSWTQAKSSDMPEE